MNGRARRTFRAFAATALALALALTGLAPVWAEVTPKISEGTAQSPAQAAITKELKVPKGTTIPKPTYSFKATKHSFNLDDQDTDGKAAMPALTLPDIEITDADIEKAVTDQENNVTSVIKESANIATGFGAAFTEIGVYGYDIEEDVSTFEYSPVEDAYLSTHESEAVYRVYFHVEKQDETYYIKYIEARRVDYDDGSEDPDEEKVDPTPGGGDEYDYSQMIFTNEYAVTNNGGGDPEDPDEDDTDYSTLFVSNEVTGEGANKDNLYFPFRITITDPKLDDADFPTYRAYVLSEGRVVDDEDVGTPSGESDEGKYYEFTSGTAKDIKLKNGQKLSFVNTPVGASWIAVETLNGESTYKDYQAIVAVTVNGETPTEYPGVKGESLGTETRLIGENANKAEYENLYNDVTPPMGIIMNNLPYIGLIALALLGLAAYAAVRSRRRAYDAYSER